MNSPGRPNVGPADASKRHIVLMEVWRRTHEAGDGWMSSISQNDADVIVHITTRPREATTLYCFDDFGAWTSLSATRIAGMNSGVYFEVFYEDVRAVSRGDGKTLIVNDTPFLVPEALQVKMTSALNAVVEFVRTPHPRNS